MVQKDKYLPCISIIASQFQLPHIINELLMRIFFLNTKHWPNHNLEGLSNPTDVKHYFKIAKEELNQKLQEINRNSTNLPNIELLISILHCLSNINPSAPQRAVKDVTKNCLFNEEEIWIQDAVTRVQTILFNYSDEEETTLIAYGTQIVSGNLEAFPQGQTMCMMYLATKAQSNMEACGFNQK